MARRNPRGSSMTKAQLMIEHAAMVPTAGPGRAYIRSLR